MQRAETPSEPTRPASGRPLEGDLRARVATHALRYTVAAHRVAVTGEVQTHGWVVDVYASPARGEPDLPADEEIERLHHLLADVLDAALPTETREVGIDVDPFVGAIHLRPSTEFAAEVRVRIVIEPRTAIDDRLGAKLDHQLLDSLTEKLDALGVSPGQ